MADFEGSGRILPDHATHDPEPIVALLDPDLSGADRSAGEMLVATCASCAALHRDLVALATATASVPTPARPREFAISPETAAMLRGEAHGEPVPARARLTGEMTDPRSSHATHDRLLIANLVDRSPSDAERARGEEQLAACRDCALLHADLLALRAATAAMPVPARQRDFTLTAAEAERLRVRGWRRLLGAIGSPRDAFSRPLALGLTTLGIAGLLVATVPAALPGFGGAATSLAPAEDAARNGAGTGAAGAANPEFLAQASAAVEAPEAASAPAIAAAGPSSAPSAAPAPIAAPSAEPTPEILVEGGEPGTIAGEPSDQGAFDTYQDSFNASPPTGPSPLVLVAAVLLLAGLGLFGLRWTARRLGDG